MIFSSAWHSAGTILLAGHKIELPDPVGAMIVPTESISAFQDRWFRPANPIASVKWCLVLTFADMEGLMLWAKEDSLFSQVRVVQSEPGQPIVLIGFSVGRRFAVRLPVVFSTDVTTGNY